MSSDELMLLNCGVGEDFESTLNCKEIQPVNPKGNQSWMFIGRTDVEPEIPILRPPDAKNWLIWKDPTAGKDWMWEEKGMTKDEIVGCSSLTQWIRVWTSSESWWWTGRSGVLQSVGSQRIGHGWVTERRWDTCRVWINIKQRSTMQLKSWIKRYFPM